MTRFVVVAPDELMVDLDKKSKESKKSRNQFVVDCLTEKIDEMNAAVLSETNRVRSEYEIIKEYLDDVKYTYVNYFNDGNKVSDSWMNSIRNILSQNKRIISDDVIRDIVLNIMKTDSIYLSRLKDGLIVKQL